MSKLTSHALVLASLVVPMLAQERAQVFDAAQVQVGPLDPAFEALFDLDADAYPDAVGALFGTASGVIGIYRNDGKGRFLPVWSASVPTWFGDNVILPGDFDGDGRRDDFVLGTKNLVGCYYFDGVGPPATVGPQSGPSGTIMRDLAVADVNRDGKDDVVVISTAVTPSTLRIATHLSTTPGAQPTIHEITVPGFGSRVRLLALADGTHVAMVQGFAPTQILPVVIGGAGSTFTVRPTLSVTERLNDAAVGDIDRDGDLDLVLFGRPTGPGEYQIVRQANFAFTAETSRVGGPATAFADIDGDGDLDGVCCGGGGGGPPLPNQRASNFEVSIHDGAGGFAPSFMIGGLGARHIAGAADVDGDGDVDLVAGRVVYFSAGAPRARPTNRSTTEWFGGEFLVGGLRDGDGDGDIDHGMTPFGGHLNTGRADFTSTPWTSPIATQYVNGMAVGDFDGDGDDDALVEVSAFGNPPITPGVWNVRQIAPGRFVLGTFALAPVPDRLIPSSYWRCYDADFDGDGIRDLVVTTDMPSGSSTSVDLSSFYRGTSAGAFVFVRNLAATVKAMADFDRDGLPDLLLANASAHYSLARNLGGGAFAAGQVLMATMVDSHHDRPAVGDLDGDRDLDLILPQRNPSAQQSTIVVFHNDGAGVFAAQPHQPAFPNFGSASSRVVQVADADGDRMQDVLVFPGHETAWGTTILLGTGQGGFVRTATEIFTAELVADLDGDGATDALQMSGSQNVLSKARATTTRGSFEQRGTSGAGSGGFAMTFGALGPRRIDQFLELRVRGALGGAFAVVVLGPNAGDLRDVFGPGHHFYLDPTAPLITVPVVLAGAPGVAGQGTLALPVYIPPSLLGVELHHQIGVVDPGTPNGLATSNGLRLSYGR